MVVVGPIIVRGVASAKLRAHGLYAKTEMAWQIAADLPAAVADVVEEHVPRRLDCAAGEHERTTTNRIDAAVLFRVLDAIDPARILAQDTCHRRVGKECELARL